MQWIHAFAIKELRKICSTQNKIFWRDFCSVSRLWFRSRAELSSINKRPDWSRSSNQDAGAPLHALPFFHHSLVFQRQDLHHSDRLLSLGDFPPKQQNLLSLIIFYNWKQIMFFKRMVWLGYAILISFILCSFSFISSSCDRAEDFTRSVLFQRCFRLCCSSWGLWRSRRTVLN